LRAARSPLSGVRASGEFQWRDERFPKAPPGRGRPCPALFRGQKKERPTRPLNKPKAG